MPDTTNGNGSLLAALLAFQADAPHIPLDSTNPHFGSKFASLPDVSKAVRPKLAEHGLVWTTMPSQDEQGRPTLKYKIAHAGSGQSEQGEMPLLPTKSDPQSLGSALTYARRYSLLAVLGLVGDDDDDGNRASRPREPDGPPFGPEADAGLSAAASTAVLEMAGGDMDVAKERWRAVKVACGGTLPQVVAAALCAAAGVPQPPDGPPPA